MWCEKGKKGLKGNPKDCQYITEEECKRKQKECLESLEEWETEAKGVVFQEARVLNWTNPARRLQRATLKTHLSLGLIPRSSEILEKGA
jgi:hypothetical protein